MSGSTWSLSRPRIINNIIKAGIFGSIAGAIIYGTVSEATSAAGYALALLSWPFVAGFVRNLHALAIRPHFILTPEGIDLRIWWPVGFPSFRMFSPVYQLFEARIAWSQYKGCRTYTHSVNAIPNWRSLILDTSEGEVIIGWDVFLRSVDVLQSGILDYIEIQFRQPLREQAKLSEFNRLRFQSPVRVEASSVGLWVAFLVLCLDVVVAAILKIVIPRFPDSGWVWVNIILTIAVFGCLFSWSQTVGRRILELRADGLAVGGRPERLRVIPWEEILFVRASRKTESYSGSGGVPATQSLEIRFRHGPSMTLHGSYKRTLDDLNELLDPPISKVEAARERLAQGEDIETAAVGAGLPKKG